MEDILNDSMFAWSIFHWHSTGQVWVEEKDRDGSSLDKQDFYNAGTFAWNNTK